MGKYKNYTIFQSCFYSHNQLKMLLNISKRCLYASAKTYTQRTPVYNSNTLSAKQEKTKDKTAGKAKQTTRTAPFITPPMDTDQRQRITSSIGVRIGVTSVSWARLELSEDMNSPSVLTHWQHHEINDKKLHLGELVRRALYVAHQIPAADCYVMETPQMAQASSNPGSIDQQNVNIQKAQVTAMLSYALMARVNVDEVTSNLYYMRRFLTARLFNHLVGTERVALESTIIDMMRTHYNLEDAPPDVSKESTAQERSMLCKQVQFPEHLREMFSKMQRYQREMLGQAFLLNLAFLRLVLLQDDASIAAVSRGAKKLPSDTTM